MNLHRSEICEKKDALELKRKKTSVQVTWAEAYRIKWYYICLTKQLHI